MNFKLISSFPVKQTKFILYIYTSNLTQQMSAIFNREMSSNYKITDNFNKSIKLYKQVQSYIKKQLQR